MLNLLVFVAEFMRSEINSIDSSRRVCGSLDYIGKVLMIEEEKICEQNKKVL
jgi:hypothetical protein